MTDAILFFIFLHEVQRDINATSVVKEENFKKGCIMGWIGRWTGFQGVVLQDSRFCDGL